MRCEPRRSAQPQPDRARCRRSHPERALVQPSRRAPRGSPASRCSTRARAATMDWIAGKTGTPTFPNDDRSLDELARLCARRRRRSRAAIAARADRCARTNGTSRRTAPIRNDPRWTKAIGVLTERNWIARHRPHPRRRRPRAQSRRRDRACRSPRVTRATCRVTPDEARSRRQRKAATRRDAAASVEAPLVWTFDGPFATCLAGHGGHASARDRPGRRRVADRRADRSVAAGAEAAHRRGRGDSAGVGTIRRSPDASATGCPPARACGTSNGAGRWRRW